MQIIKLISCIRQAAPRHILQARLHLRSRSALSLQINKPIVMLKIILKTLPVAGLLLCTSCASHWQMTGVERSRILVDKRYDAQPDAQAAAFLKPFADEVNKEMSPVVGRTARYMASHRPESELSNLLSDILIWGGARFGEKPDFGVYNIGGIRAALPQGEVTVGDVLDVAPFDNKIYFLTLTGDKVLELFSQIAHRGGEGVSHSVCLHISRDGKLLSATVGGQPVDKNRSYRIATLDYVSQGNDEMVAFKAKTDVVAPDSESNNLRFIIMDYLRELASKGQAADSKVEGRIVVDD